MKKTIYIILTVIFGLFTISKGIETIGDVLHLEILNALWDALVAFCAYVVTAKISKEI